VEHDGRVAEARDVRTVQLAHASPGRIRLRVDRSEPDPIALGAVQQYLREHHGDYDLALNPTTRSLLIRYDAAIRQLPEVLEAIAEAGVHFAVADTGAPSEPPPDTMALGIAAETLASRVNQWVIHRTSGGADLRTIVPVTFALLAVREILSGRLVAVPWYAFAWYAFDSYWKLRQTPRADGARPD
jgi:hypothetical protein